LTQQTIQLLLTIQLQKILRIRIFMYPYFTTYLYFSKIEDDEIHFIFNTFSFEFYITDRRMIASKVYLRLTMKILRSFESYK
jgi:hypothetical protein